MPTESARARRARPRRRGVLIVAALLALVVLVALALLWSGSRKPSSPGTDVVRVTRADQTSTVAVSGKLAPQKQANVSFAVPGTVERVSTKVGDQVKAGQQLATIQDRELRNAVTLAQAQAAAASAQLQAVRDAGASSAQVAAARAQVESANAAVTQARSRLEDAALTSPIDGVVAEVSIEVGDQVSGASGSLGGLSGSMPSLPSGMSGIPGMSGLGSSGGGSVTGASASAGPNIVVVVPGAWKLDATVGTADLPLLKAGQRAVVTPTGTTTHVAATVETVGIVATGASGEAASFPVTIVVNDSSASLFSGSDADAVITTETVPAVLTVPAEAVTFTGDASTVRRPGVAEPVGIQTGRRFGDRIEVTSGLSEGDEVEVPKGVVVTKPPRPQYGPNGSMASPDASASPKR